MLPFTGSASATADNLERATLYAADRINDGGGVNGVKVHVISRDTHSDLDRGVASANDLADAGAVAVIGPESAGKIAAALVPVLAEKKVAFLSPFVGAGDEPARQCTTPWFRLAPSAKALGEALAKQANDQHVARVGVLYSSSPYDRALGGAAADRFVTLGGEVALQIELNPDAQSYSTAVSQAIAAGVTDVILAASPRAGAILVNEFDALSSKEPHWFLSPLLKTDLLVQNVAPRAPRRAALGVAPKNLRNWLGIPRRLLGSLDGGRAARWRVLLLRCHGTACGRARQVDVPQRHRARPESHAMLLDAAGPPGEVVRWNEIEVALSRLRRGEDLYYTGLTGPLTLETCGARSTGITSNWTVQKGAIVDLAE